MSLRCPMALLLLLVLPPRASDAGPITLGQGPALGTDRAGVTWYEEFQDWTAADLLALDDVAVNGDTRYAFGDGLDDSRDLVAFYAREEGDNLYFRVDLHDLSLGAEVNALDIYLAIDAAPGGQVWLPDFLDVQTDQLWELCLCIYRAGTVSGTHYRLYDDAFGLVTGGYLGSYFHSELDAVEFGITRQVLLDQGWDGVSPLTFQVMTAKDATETTCTGGVGSSDLADAFVDDDRGCADGVLNGGISSTDSGGLVYLSSIAHGNQSVNQADEIGSHIYDSAANTGIPGGTGFQRTLDTHEIFNVPLNIHPSGTLTIAAQWAHTAGGATDPSDGPTFIARVKDFVDANQADTPGALIGGVLAEHIMPYFEGDANALSLSLTDQLNQTVYGISAADAKVMHVPERVIRSNSTGLSPLDGHTFEDIGAGGYTATYLDEVTHLHHWFYPGETCTPDQGYRHKVHTINGVHCFMINEREDGKKFANHDGGMWMDMRESLIQKAVHGGSSEMVVLFDDWEAFAGKSFEPLTGQIIPNNNPNQYHTTVRWAANHPWIRWITLRDLLAVAQGDPGSFIIDHGTRFDLPLETYEWLKHATEDSYHNWYYNNTGGAPGNEQSFYDLVPVITGPQGDYHLRGVTPASDGPPLPSGMSHGDLNTPGTLMYEAWAALQGAPANGVRTAGLWGFQSLIYETAWHEENETDYADTDCYQNWTAPDGSWDGLNTWALRLANHVREAGLYAAAARWVDDVAQGIAGPAPVTQAVDLDFDGESEYVVSNDKVWLAFERYGGRCVLGVAYDPATQDGTVLIGAPLSNPSSPGEEELVGPLANRCSAFKDMNGGTYADAVYAAVAVPGGWRFTSGDAAIEKTITLSAGSASVAASYVETVSGPLFVRFGLSPNPVDLALSGHANLTGTFNNPATIYTLANANGGSVAVDQGTAAFVLNPTDAGFDRRNLALTEQVELGGDGSFGFTLTLLGGAGGVTAAPDPSPGAGFLRGPSPSPTRSTSRIAFTLQEAGPVRIEVLDVSGRRVQLRELGQRPEGDGVVTLRAVDASGDLLPAGMYFVRVQAGRDVASRKWVVMR